MFPYTKSKLMVHLVDKKVLPKPAARPENRNRDKATRCHHLQWGAVVTGISGYKYLATLSIQVPGHNNCYLVPPRVAIVSQPHSTYKAWRCRTILIEEDHAI